MKISVSNFISSGPLSLYFSKSLLNVILALPPFWIFDCPSLKSSGGVSADLSIKYPCNEWRPRKNIFTNRAGIDIQIRPIEADYFVVQICSSVQSNGCWSALLPEQTVGCCWESTPARFSGWRHLLCDCAPPPSPWLFLAFINPSPLPAVGFIVPSTCCPIGIHFVGCELSGQIMSTIVALTCLPYFSVLSNQSVWHSWNCHQFSPVYVGIKLDHIGWFSRTLAAFIWNESQIGIVASTNYSVCCSK